MRGHGMSGLYDDAVSEKQWLGDLWGISKETWFEIWVNAIPAVIGGLFALAVAVLIFRLERAKEKRRGWSDATLDLISALGGIAQRGLGTGPQFDTAEINRIVQRWAILSPLPRRRATHLTGGILKWLGVWRHVGNDTVVQERTLSLPYSRSQYLETNADFLHELLAALHMLEGAGPLKAWTFYQRCYFGCRNVLNKRFSLAVQQQLAGSASVSVTFPLPRPWSLLVSLANRLGLYKGMFTPSRSAGYAATEERSLGAVLPTE